MDKDKLINNEIDEINEFYEDFLAKEEQLTKEHVFTGDFHENVIEWYNGQDVICVTLSQKRLINKVMKLANSYPNEVRIDKINDDGTVLCHLPLSYLKFQRPRELSEEEKQKARERFEKYRKIPNKKES